MRAASVREVALSQGSSIAGQTAQRSSVLAAVIAGIGLALVAIRVLHLVGAPIATDDVWWHLRLGEEYTVHGPWLASDPLLYTAVEGAPPPHAWLFGVAVSAVDRSLGLHGLRVVHVAIVVFIIGLAYSIFRRESGVRAPAFLATIVFLVLTADRLPRLRPDLFSISAALLLYLLLLQGDEPPSWRRVAASVLLVLVWANFHAAFAVGPLFLVAALFGLAVRIGLRRFKDARGRELPESGGASASEGHWIRAVATALVLGLLAALLNPRGIEQHLSFLSSASGSALWAIADDWAGLPSLLLEPESARTGSRRLAHGRSPSAVLSRSGAPCPAAFPARAEREHPASQRPDALRAGSRFLRRHLRFPALSLDVRLSSALRAASALFCARRELSQGAGMGLRARVRRAGARLSRRPTTQRLCSEQVPRVSREACFGPLPGRRSALSGRDEGQREPLRPLLHRRLLRLLAGAEAFAAS